MAKEPMAPIVLVTQTKIQIAQPEPIKPAPKPSLKREDVRDIVSKELQKLPKPKVIRTPKPKAKAAPKVAKTSRIIKNLEVPVEPTLKNPPGRARVDPGRYDMLLS